MTAQKRGPKTSRMRAEAWWQVYDAISVSRDIQGRPRKRDGEHLITVVCNLRIHWWRPLRIPLTNTLKYTAQNAAPRRENTWQITQNTAYSNLLRDSTLFGTRRSTKPAMCRGLKREQGGPIAALWNVRWALTVCSEMRQTCTPSYGLFFLLHPCVTLCVAHCLCKNP